MLQSTQKKTITQIIKNAAASVVDFKTHKFKNSLVELFNEFSIITAFPDMSIK